MGNIMIGDLVVCIDNQASEYELTLGKVYKIYDIHRVPGYTNMAISISNDKQDIIYFSSNRFISLEIHRNNVITDILG